MPPYPIIALISPDGHCPPSNPPPTLRTPLLHKPRQLIPAPPAPRLTPIPQHPRSLKPSTQQPRPRRRDKAQSKLRPPSPAACQIVETSRLRIVTIKRPIRPPHHLPRFKDRLAPRRLRPSHNPLLNRIALSLPRRDPRVRRDKYNQRNAHTLQDDPRHRPHQNAPPHRPQHTIVRVSRATDLPGSSGLVGAASADTAPPTRAPHLPHTVARHPPRIRSITSSATTTPGP